MNMTVKQFNIWLATNGYNQSSLALAMGINRQTITGYKNNGRFPILFVLALKGLEYERLNVAVAKEMRTLKLYEVITTQGMITQCWGDSSEEAKAKAVTILCVPNNAIESVKYIKDWPK